MSYLPQKQWMNYTTIYIPNPAPPIHPLPVKGKMDITVKTVHNP